jgi:EamA domain-containing membrane protein RarD
VKKTCAARLTLWAYTRNSNSLSCCVDISASVGFNGAGAFLHDSTVIDVLLIGAGAVTTIPLLMFASAAKQIPLTMIGVLQYLAPSIQFLLGIFVYKEVFDNSRLIGFGLVWLALIIFWIENYLANRVPVEPIPEMGEG